MLIDVRRPGDLPGTEPGGVVLPDVGLVESRDVELGQDFEDRSRKVLADALANRR